MKGWSLQVADLERQLRLELPVLPAAELGALHDARLSASMWNGMMFTRCRPSGWSRRGQLGGKRERCAGAAGCLKPPPPPPTPPHGPARALSMLATCSASKGARVRLHAAGK